MVRFDLYASLMRRMDLSRPTVIGITTPGKRTVLRRGSMGNSSGMTSLFICSSSSLLINGINSVSSSLAGEKFIRSAKFLFIGSKCQVNDHCLPNQPWYRVHFATFSLLPYRVQCLCHRLATAVMTN